MSNPPSDQSHATDAQWTAVWALLLAAFVTLLDVTVVNLAVPSIAADLQATDVQSQWILLAYLLPLAALLLPLGRFGDALGRRRLFLVGVTGFAIGGLAAGTAQSILVLIAARVLQGVGAATMMPQVLALTQVILPPDQRRRAVGYFGMVSALGAVAGPIIGGAILTIDLFGLGWRAVFLLVIPPCILSSLTVVSFLDRDGGAPSKKIDVWQGQLVALAVTGLVFAAVQGRPLGWPLWLVALSPASVLLLVYVIYTQRNRVSDKIEPLLPSALLRSASFLQPAFMILLVFCGIAGVPFLLAIALQAGPQLPPGAVAMALAAHPVFAVAGAAVAGQWSPANPWTLPGLGSVLTCAGIALIVFAFAQAGDDITALVLLVPLALVGLGMGLSNVALMSGALATASNDVAGAASGLLQTAQQIGITLSIAIVGSLYFANTSGATSDAASAALLFPGVIFAAATLLCGLGAVFHKKKET
ncbi:MFS transporter [Thalassococcus sp. S3]|uniref:MFS transporter n=1 Tax=Thalassococcus sp. S3 TaxID=2017482 RepID=UPI0010241AC9|nr:MFS transporter [Thalassococcus sp. S3]QBF33358.1 MFS transporter [Thalassococcus sp. S3]